MTWRNDTIFISRVTTPLFSQIFQNNYFNRTMNVRFIFLLMSPILCVNIYTLSDGSTDIQVHTYCYQRLLRSYNGLLDGCPKMGRWKTITSECKRRMKYKAVKGLLMKSPFCSQMFLWNLKRALNPTLLLIKNVFTVNLRWAGIDRRWGWTRSASTL